MATLLDTLRESAESKLPRIGMISTHGYVAAEPPLGAADTGGQVVYVLELSLKLASLGYQVDIWTRQFEEQPEVDIINDRVRVLRVPCGGKDFIPKEYLYKSLPEWCENALRAIQTNSIDYTFFNSHYWDAGLAGQNLSKVLGVPHIHTPHSLGRWKQEQMATDFGDGAAAMEEQYNFNVRIDKETIVFTEAQMVIATTPVQTDMLIEDYGVPRGRLRMIPPGYDDNRFFPVGRASRTVIREKNGISGKTILALGRLAENKGYDLLVKAFKLVADRDPDTKLHLAVGGDNLGEHEQGQFDELVELVDQLGLVDRVVFGGFITDDDLPDHYRAADVFVLCSRYEPFGMTAIEAMACGTPTVVTCHGGLWRAVVYGRHALIADPFDTEDLGITIFKLLQLPKLAARMRSRAARRMRALFTWTGIAQQLIATVEARTSASFKTPDALWDEEEENWLDDD